MTDPGVDRAGSAVGEAVRDLLAVLLILCGLGALDYAALTVSLPLLLTALGGESVAAGLLLGVR